MLTDRRTEYCGNRECHDYQLYLALENIDHSRTKAKSPQTNGIGERFHRTLQEEFYSVGCALNTNLIAVRSFAATVTFCVDVPSL